MRTQNARLSISRAIRLAAAAAVGLFLAALPAAAQKAFDSPRQAADALVQAAASGDNAALLAIFGPDGKDLVQSGDAVEDKNRLAEFSKLAKEKLHVATDPKKPGTAVVEVGPEDWPLPIPLVQKSGKWRYDTKAGRQEVLARRIGGNELEAINLLRGYVEAQEEYASAARDGKTRPEYAQKWVSSPGRQDGLSWKNPDGTAGGPIGDVVAKALAAGYTSKAEPFNGYHFRTLAKQGPAARLGEREYVVNGRMIGGFAGLAWPANYGVTGIMTFVVNNDGVVYQKDLGPDTAKIAATLDSYNPDKSWEVTDDEQ